MIEIAWFDVFINMIWILLCLIVGIIILAIVGVAGGVIYVLANDKREELHSIAEREKRKNGK